MSTLFARAVGGAATRASSQRNVILLALCQAFFMTSTSAIITVAALVGHGLAEDKALATLPLAMQFASMMVVTIPASLHSSLQTP